MLCELTHFWRRGHLCITVSSGFQPIIAFQLFSLDYNEFSNLFQLKHPIIRASLKSRKFNSLPRFYQPERLHLDQNVAIKSRTGMGKNNTIRREFSWSCLWCYFWRHCLQKAWDFSTLLMSIGLLPWYENNIFCKNLCHSPSRFLKLDSYSWWSVTSQERLNELFQD